MSYSTWHEYGYGFIGSYIKNVSPENLKEFLHLAPRFEENFLEQGFLDSFTGDCAELADFEDPDSCGGMGLSAIIKCVIQEAEEIPILCCTDYDEQIFIMYSATYPWLLTEKEKGLTEQTLKEMFLKYLTILLGEEKAKEIWITYQSCENGG